ncbi:MAG: SGNH/GDSL hydrolase family protein [Clostridia bacterium]|nr:SGNH/GDSL hydrolase family protein [Clostridia bacterium]
MKKVTLLGDSIRLIGYGSTVAHRLSDEFTVWQPAENCRFAQHTLRGLWEWADEIAGSDVVHWNNGIWDVCRLFDDGTFTPIDRYVELMVRIASLLKQRAKVVIFATTTPVRDGDPRKRNEDITAFNEALVPKLRALGVVINDLHALVSADIPRYVREDDRTHLTDEGIAVCAAQVEKVIREEAQKL